MRSGPNPRLALFALFLALLLGGGLVYWQYRWNRAMNEKVEALRAKALDRDALNLKLEQSATKLGEMQLQLTHLEQGIPELAYMPTFLRELQQVGLQNGITVTGVRPLEQPSGSSSTADTKIANAYQQIDIQVDGRGTYDSVRAFVDALRQFPKIVEVRTISLSPANDRVNQTPAVLLATTTLRAYVFPPGQTGLAANASALEAGAPLGGGSNFDRRNVADDAAKAIPPSGAPPAAGGSTP